MENMVLVLALCFPVFMVVLFDTGILYQVGVFVFGCTDGLTKLGLGQVVTWNDLVKQFERGAAPPPGATCPTVTHAHYTFSVRGNAALE